MARWNYKETQSGSMIPLSVKVEDTLPVGFEGEIADGTPIPEGWVQVETLLYQGQGNTSTLTLNDAIENYDEIEIQYNLGDMYEIKRLRVKSSGQYLINVIWGANSDTLIMSTKRFTISGTTLTLESGRTVEMEFRTTGNTLSGYNADVSRIVITKIIGYKS